jgi:transposase
MFTTKDLFSKALMIDLPWFIEKMQFNQPEGKFDIWIDFEEGSKFFFEDKALGTSGKFKVYDTRQKTWRHKNFFQYQCYLHAKVPRVVLGNGKYRLVSTPWEGLTNGFTLLFEAMLMVLVRLMPVRQVSNLCGLTDHRLWALMKKYTTLARAEADYSAVTQIGVDETAARKGHDYVSLFVDVEKHQTRYVAKGRDHQVLQSFCADIQEHNDSPEQIEQLSCDMSAAFIKASMRICAMPRSTLSGSMTSSSSTTRWARSKKIFPEISNCSIPSMPSSTYIPESMSIQNSIDTALPTHFSIEPYLSSE